MARLRQLFIEERTVQIKEFGHHETAVIKKNNPTSRVLNSIMVQLHRLEMKSILDIADTDITLQWYHLITQVLNMDRDCLD